MIKYSFEIDDLKGTLTRQQNGKYFLQVEEKDMDGVHQEFEKEVTEDEAACILFHSFDPSTGILDDDRSYDVANNALKDCPVCIIP